MAAADASAFLIGSCFEIEGNSRAVARRSKDGRKSGDLHGVKADIENMSNIFTRIAKIEVKEKWLHDEKEPTAESKEALMTAMRAFFSQKGKSNFVLYYSGHGTPEGDWVLNSIESDGDDKDEFITLQDVIALWEVHGKREKNRLMIIADTCHSGRWVDKLNEMERKDIAMNASCQANNQCYDTPKGGDFTTAYIAGCEEFFAGPRKLLKAGCLLVVNGFTLGIPIIAKYLHYSKAHNYQPVCTNTESNILPLFDSFTEATLGSHWVA